jgi:hypothetical protein
MNAFLKYIQSVGIVCIHFAYSQNRAEEFHLHSALNE